MIIKEYIHAINVLKISHFSKASNRHIIKNAKIATLKK